MPYFSAEDWFFWCIASSFAWHILHHLWYWIKIWENYELHADETYIRHILLFGAEKGCIIVFVMDHMFNGDFSLFFSFKGKQWGRQMVGRQTGKKNKLAGRIQISLPASCQSSNQGATIQPDSQTTGGPTVFKSVKNPDRKKIKQVDWEKSYTLYHPALGMIAKLTKTVRCILPDLSMLEKCGVLDWFNHLKNTSVEGYCRKYQQSLKDHLEY